MKNHESHPLFEDPEIKTDITEHVEVMYSPEKLTTAYINRMFGLEDGDLDQEQIKELATLFKYTGELLLRTSLEKKSLGNIDEIKQAIRDHVEHYANFKTHDLIHVVAEHAINNHPSATEDEKDSVIPEFLQEQVNDAQAIREEFPAVLWTPIGEQQPIFLDLISAENNKVLQTLRERGEEMKVNRLEAFMNDMNRQDFNSVCNVYTEILLYLTYEVAKKESKLEGADLELWKENHKEAQNIVKESLRNQLNEFEEAKNFSKTDKGSRTEQLFIEQAHSIFENINTDKMASFNGFMELANQLLKDTNSSPEN